MIIMMNPEVEERHVQAVLKAIAELGHKHHLTRLKEAVVISINNKAGELDAALFATSHGVIKVHEIEVSLPTFPSAV